jgi:hypothetical protein
MGFPSAGPFCPARAIDSLECLFTKQAPFQELAPLGLQRRRPRKVGRACGAQPNPRLTRAGRGHACPGRGALTSRRPRIRAWGLHKRVANGRACSAGAQCAGAKPWAPAQFPAGLSCCGRAGQMQSPRDKTTHQRVLREGRRGCANPLPGGRAPPQGLSTRQAAARGRRPRRRRPPQLGRRAAALRCAAWGAWRAQTLAARSTLSGRPLMKEAAMSSDRTTRPGGGRVGQGVGAGAGWGGAGEGQERVGGNGWQAAPVRP